MIESFILKAKSLNHITATLATMIKNKDDAIEISSAIDNCGALECRLKECALDGFCVNQLDGALIAPCYDINI